ncbi:DUF6114 domain-containing protein [Streptomyces albireticuli]|uniref:Uncharacterized protein n=1 Tax=Streptomyces albireticuli TaxID=1940 RepID=A0A2A2D7G5_9ACTN|nr:DUF6114 domain-containing protein [Streptomyces albireticuli]MCD9143187.1 DUF6114 domain-containing protein [Streptomyces albireticuli]MCD9163629.1 DUF6114 domain-containing protein [Streptomyces albireticuli]MCD9191304.1 DUF6114 domain-containing protein [Streptomyces albireticuli]PAU47262.1 hypothetical protein CK936_19750 [Streptomyces albireticuli]
MLLTRRALPGVRVPAWPDARRTFRSWRRTRPFWAGLLLVLGGAELLAVPLSPVTVLVSLGLGGLAAIGIGLALIVAGLFLWYAPAARRYVSLNALILSVLSFAATNLGGFLVGMALGIAGSAMGFGWTPAARPPDEPPVEGPGAPGRAPGGGPKALAAVLPVVLLAAVGTPAAHRAEAAPRGGDDVRAAAAPPTVRTTLFAPHGFAFAGVTRVPTAAGPLKVMVLTMRAASLADYRLTTRDGGGAELALGADTLELSGRVTLYLTRFSGCLEGLLCVTFSPDGLPVPPVVPPFVFMTDVTAEQALVTSDLIVADRLTLNARGGS